jgi:hypothetical protein
LLKNSSRSGFIARQVASYLEQINCLTIPELGDLAKRHGLNPKGKKQQLLTRLSIWVRDQVASTAAEDDVEAYVNDETKTDPKSTEKILEAMLEMSDDSSTSSSELELIEVKNEHDKSKSLWLNDRHSHSDESDDEFNAECSGVSSNANHSSTVDICPLRASLLKHFGHSDFRDGQEWAIRRCLGYERTLLVAPTGLGKSLCYTMTAALKSGICIVVSPLISLIQDQLRVLPPCLPGVTLSGQMATSKMASTIDDIIRGRIKVVFVSPERLTSASFRRLFRHRWNPDTKCYERSFPPVSLLCVDEAHCLSQWAHNFRPSYLRLRSMMELIRPESILAITATAGPRVVNDICRTLNIQSASGFPETDCGVQVMKTDRDNIDVSCFMFSTQEERLKVVRFYSFLN